MTAAQTGMLVAAGGDIDRIIACGRRNPRLLLEGLYTGRTALHWASYYGEVKGS